jgi:hypothetical protein
VLGDGFATASQMDLLDTLTELIEQVLEVVSICGKLRARTIYMGFDNCHEALSSQQR